MFSFASKSPTFMYQFIINIGFFRVPISIPLRTGFREAPGVASVQDGPRSLPYLDHLVALGLGVPPRHGQDPDLLGLGAAVSEREGHLPVGGAVCGVRPGRTEKERDGNQNTFTVD